MRPTHSKHHADRSVSSSNRLHVKSPKHSYHPLLAIGFCTASMYSASVTVSTIDNPAGNCDCRRELQPFHHHSFAKGSQHSNQTIPAHSPCSFLSLLLLYFNLTVREPQISFKVAIEKLETPGLPSSCESPVMITGSALAPSRKNSA